MSNEPDIEFKVYNRLTRVDTDDSRKKRWTLNLIICCLTVATGSLQFGYNISSMNSVSDNLQSFIHKDMFLFAEYYEKEPIFRLNEQWLNGNETKLNSSKAELDIAKQQYIESRFSLNLTWRAELEERRQAREKEIHDKYNKTIDEYIEYATNTIAEKKAKLESYRVKLAEGKDKLEKGTKMLWTLTNCLFVIGGMIGTFKSKLIMDRVGRKSAIVLHHLFSIVASAIVLAAPYLRSPVCVMVSRLLFGIQGGMSCTLVPTYLSEISPAALRGRTGVIHQLFITIGILIAQILGMRQLLGTQHMWHFLLAVPSVPALLGAFVLMFFMPESPRALLSKNMDKESTREALTFLRNSDDVEEELEELMAEAKGGNAASELESEETVSVLGLFRNMESRMAIVTSLVLHITQQLSGINAVFFYSSSIFKDAGISAENIQYAILSTGIVNVITTVICVPLIDKLGRKPLLIYPMAFMIIDFMALIFLLKFKGDSLFLSYMSIVCIMLFVVCFAIGLGPIPFIYTAECFRQNARSSAMALSTLFNWSAGLLLTLGFPFLLDAIQQYVFFIFSGIIALALAMIVIKVPETKGKSIEEIIAKFTQFKSDY